MSFCFATKEDGTLYNSFIGLIKTNNGQFKSLNQSNFLNSVYKNNRPFDTVDSVKNLFNIDLLDGQVIVECNAWVRWANYGVKSGRPVTWVFVIDHYGIVAQYKLGYIGSTDTGTIVDPKKTSIVWQRSLPVKEFEVKVEAKSNFVGEIGKRVELEAKIAKISSFEKPRFHYYDSNVGFITILESNSNKLVYFGKFPGLSESDTVKIKATIKEHSVRNGINQTIINRPKIVESSQI